MSKSSACGSGSARSGSGMSTTERSPVLTLREGSSTVCPVSSNGPANATRRLSISAFTRLRVRAGKAAASARSSRSPEALSSNVTKWRPVSLIYPCSWSLLGVPCSGHNFRTALAESAGDRDGPADRRGLRRHRGRNRPAHVYLQRPAPAGSTFAEKIALPSGAQVLSMNAVGDRLVVHVEGQDGLSTAYIVDPRSGALLGTIAFPPSASR